MKKKEKIIYSILVMLSIIFIILGYSLKVRVYRGKEYTERNEIALYIYKYRELPSNYIKKEDNPYQTTKEALENGYSFGGSIFDYKGEITEYTKNEDLREADYYPNLEENLAKESYGPGESARGKYRLVYTASGKKEVFYSESHYNQKPKNNFKRLSIARINLASNIMWICFGQTFSGVIVMTIFIEMRENKKGKVLLNGKKI